MRSRTADDFAVDQSVQVIAQQPAEAQNVSLDFPQRIRRFASPPARLRSRMFFRRLPRLSMSNIEPRFRSTRLPTRFMRARSDRLLFPVHMSGMRGGGRPRPPVPYTRDKLGTNPEMGGQVFTGQRAADREAG